MRPLAVPLLALLAACHPPAPPSAAPAPPPPSPQPMYPATPKRPVVTDFHGVSVVDPYQWLEKSDDPEVQQWTTEQARRARAYLDAMPGNKALRDRFTALKTAQSPRYSSLEKRGGVLFALKLEPPKQQPLLVTLPSLDDPASAQVIVDPNALDPTGKTTIDFYAPSLDGKKVAVSLSRNGTEDGDVHVYDLAAGGELAGDLVPHVNGGTAGGSVAWNADGSGFYYTRYPRAGERAPEDMGFYQQVYVHTLGEPTERDRFAIGKDFPRVAEIELHTSDDGRYVLAQVANGDGGEFAHYLLDRPNGWRQIARFSDKVTRVSFGRGNRLYLLSRDDAPKGKLLRLSLDHPLLSTAQTVLPEGEGTLQAFEVTATRLYVVDLLGGPSRARVFDLDGKAEALVPIPPVASVGEIARLGGALGEEVLFRVTTFIEPPSWYRFTGTGTPERTKLSGTSAADFSDTEVVRETCTSKDGTRVPLSILRRKNIRRDRENPALLTGYGGFSVPVQPSFNDERRVWLDAGGVYAVANIRGGNELGEAWHAGGSLTKKQNVFDDFAACAQHLVEAGYTKPEKLALVGGSNGGLLMGAMITQHPDLFRAVVSRVGLYDMLRFELWPNGAFNVSEFGSAKDAEQFKALYAYSPYHHVEDGKAYPSVLLTTGLNDPRVDPGQSRKMAARLQAATSSRAPILLLARADAGHGVGGSLAQEIDQATDLYGFLLHELGVEYPGNITAPKTPPAAAAPPPGSSPGETASP